MSVTAGTIFGNSKIPLVVWFRALLQLKRTRGRTSSVELGRQLGLRQSTAWLMKHKLMRVYALEAADLDKHSPHGIQ